MEAAKVLVLIYASDKERLIGGRSSGGGSNLCVSEVEVAVNTAHCDDEDDGLFVCSCTLLQQELQTTQKEVSPTLYTLGETSFSHREYCLLETAAAASRLRITTSSFEGMPTTAA